MQIGLGVGVTRLGVAETITALWTFAHAQGLLADDIGERTSAHGVEIDGLLVKDAGVPAAAVTAHEAALAILESQIADGSILARLAAAESVSGAWSHSARLTMDDADILISRAASTDGVLNANVIADAYARFVSRASGELLWGPGDGAQDTNLYREGVGALRTDSDLKVIGTFNPTTRVLVSERTPSSFASDQHNFNAGSTVLQWLNNTSGSAKDVTGFAGGIPGRVIIIRIKDASYQVDLRNQNGSSTAANRMMLPAGATFSITGSQAIVLYYDGALTRWVPLADSS